MLLLRFLRQLALQLLEALRRLALRLLEAGAERLGGRQQVIEDEDEAFEEAAEDQEPPDEEAAEAQVDRRERAKPPARRPRSEGQGPQRPTGPARDSRAAAGRRPSRGGGRPTG
jgi:hypothetical protein